MAWSPAAYAVAIRKSRKWLEHAAYELEELGIGGSAAGTGLNTHPDYRYKVVARLMGYTGIDFRPAPDMREAMQPGDGQRNESHPAGQR